MLNLSSETEMINKQKAVEQQSLLLLKNISQAIDKLSTSKYFFATDDKKASAKGDMQWAVRQLQSGNLTNEERNKHLNTLQTNYQASIFGKSDIKNPIKIDIKAYGEMIKLEHTVIQGKNMNFIVNMENENKQIKIESKQLKIENKQLTYYAVKLELNNKNLTLERNDYKSELFKMHQEQKKDRKKSNKRQDALENRLIGRDNIIHNLVKTIHVQKEETNQLHSSVNMIKNRLADKQYTISNQSAVIKEHEKTINRLTLWQPDNKRSVTEDSNPHNSAPSSSSRGMFGL